MTDEVYENKQDTLSTSSIEETIIPFEDVPNNHWALEAIRTLKERGIINGVSDYTFGVGRKMTRAEAATILYRLQEHKENSPIGEQ